MKLRTKFPFYTSIAVLITVSVVTLYAILDYRQSTLRSIQKFKEEEIVKVKQHLKDIVDIAYEMVSVSYQNSRDLETLQHFYAGEGQDVDSTTQARESAYREASDYILNLTLENLRVLRYGGDGYIWINNVNKPYRVVMHPINPELEGQKLDGPEFNLAKGSKQNIYAHFAEIVQKSGEGYSEYDWYKPGERDVMPKISYLKLFEPTGWVIGTGVYVDNIDKIVERKKDELSKQINRMVMLITLLGLILTVVAIILLQRFANSVTDALYEISNNLSEMAKGKTVEKVKRVRDDEIGEMQLAMGAFIDGVTTYNRFSREIGKGNLEAEFNTLSDEDLLGNSLLEMRNSLRSARDEEEKRKADDDKRNWATSGFAKFGEILRENTSSIETLADNVIRSLVKYLEANQGGFFTLKHPEKEETYLELSAAFAYDQKKFLNRKIALKEGLVGTCAVERKTIYMNDVPDGYMEISSGLGEATPNCLLIVPLKIETEVLGILEIASFVEFPTHVIRFVEQLGESIAGTLKTVNINEQTARLLKETRTKSEEMASQEEEMRQNLEELRTTQDELIRKDTDSSSLIAILDQMVYRVELTITGEVEYVNDRFLGVLNQQIDEVIGQAFTNFFQAIDEETFMEVWDEIYNYGTPQNIKFRVISQGEIIWLDSIVAGILDRDEEVHKIVILAMEVSEADANIVR